MSELILSADQSLMFPAGNGVDVPIVIDLRIVYKAEARLIDLQAVTRAKAGELLHCFIEAWKEARSAFARANSQVTRAKRRLKEVRAMVVLDRGPAILKSKGLASARSPAGSEDLRDSVVALDVEYQAASDRLEQIQAAAELLEVKAETLKMAYFAVNKLIEPYDKTTSVSGGAGSDEPCTFTDTERVQEFVSKQRPINQKSYAGTGFGAAKI